VGEGGGSGGGGGGAEKIKNPCANSEAHYPRIVPNRPGGGKHVTWGTWSLTFLVMRGNIGILVKKRSTSKLRGGKMDLKKERNGVVGKKRSNQWKIKESERGR